jgi:hypothetical protein
MTGLEQEIMLAIDRNVQVDVDCSSDQTSHRIQWRGTDEAVDAIMAVLRTRGLEV